MHFEVNDLLHELMLSLNLLKKKKEHLTKSGMT